MFAIGFIGQAMVGVMAEHNAFCDYIATLPEDEREKAIANQKARFERERLDRERREYLEAVKPHNLWSFLGLGRK